MSVSISNRRSSHSNRWKNGFALWVKPLAMLVLPLFIFSQALGQSADLDQGENGSATARKSPVTWQNGNLGPSGAHFAEGYSIPYRMKIASLVGNSSTPHILVIEWDTKDQNGHALDYITHYNNMDNPSGSHQGNFGHAAEAIDPTAGTAFAGSSPTLYQIPRPSSTGAEVTDMPGLSFDALPTASRTNFADATKMAIWGGTITALDYLKQDNQDATTASTKTQLKITFTSANGRTALIAWGGHIAAEYDWGTGRGASKVNGSPYHMRLVSIDGKGGNQDRSLKADAVFVPPVGCTISAAVPACEGTSGPLTYTAGAQSGITNYSWTLDPGTTNAVISGGNTTTTKSGATVTSIDIVPAAGTTFAPGTYTLSLTLTNLGGAGAPCTRIGTINEAATAEAGDNLTACQSPNAQSVSLTGNNAGVGGSATSGTWEIVSSVPVNAGNTLSDNTLASGSLSVAANYVGVITLRLTSNDPDGTGPCAAATDTRTVTILSTPDAPTVAVKTPLCTDATMTVEVTLSNSVTSGSVTLKQMIDGHNPITKNVSEAVNGILTFSELAFGKGYSVTITSNVTTANPAGCTSEPVECGDFTAGYQEEVASAGQARITDQEIVLRNVQRANVTAAPNPFNDRIRFTLKSDVSGQGSLELYNTLGQKVKTVFQGQVKAGQMQTIEYSVPASQRTNLIYLFRVGDQRTTGKLVGLKQ